MRFRLIALALLLTLGLQPAFAAVCMTFCATPMETVPAAHHGTQPAMAGHHHHDHHQSAASHTTFADSAMLASTTCGKKLEVAAPAAPTPHVELLPPQTSTFVSTTTDVAVTLSPERSVTSSVPLHVPLRI